MAGPFVHSATARRVVTAFEQLWDGVNRGAARLGPVRGASSSYAVLERSDALAQNVVRGARGRPLQNVRRKEAASVEVLRRLRTLGRCTLRQSGILTSRLPVLDGWRATSILLVMFAHLLPLGPSWMQLNAAAGAGGMALFFTLSGFLIVSSLDRGMDLREFAIKRVARIIPLAWLAMAVLARWRHYEPLRIATNFAFVSNIDGTNLFDGGQHLWSLCVEVQFYAAVGLIVLFLGRRGLWLVPVGCLMVTAARVYAHQPISIVTWHRVDEILAGGCLGLATARGWHRHLARLPLWLGIAGLAIIAHPMSGPLQYLRPYAAAVLVGASISKPPRLMLSKPMAYIAEISFALYVLHAMLAATWLGEGDKLVKYLKRPLLFACTFSLAHVSTRYFEAPVLRWSKRFQPSRAPAGLPHPSRLSSLQAHPDTPHLPYLRRRMGGSSRSH